jgi:hypothetical protein
MTPAHAVTSETLRFVSRRGRERFGHPLIAGEFRLVGGTGELRASHSHAMVIHQVASIPGRHDQARGRDEREHHGQEFSLLGAELPGTQDVARFHGFLETLQIVGNFEFRILANELRHSRPQTTGDGRVLQRHRDAGFLTSA